MMTRRALLAAGIAAARLRLQPIRVAVGVGVGFDLEEGVRFGIEDAGRAATLLGRSLELAATAELVIQQDAVIDASGMRFTLRADDDDRATALREAFAGGLTRSQDLNTAEWHHSLAAYGASELNDRFTQFSNRRMSSSHWLGWMAVKIIAESSLRASPGQPVATVMSRARFDGHKGTALSFSSEKRRLRQPLYVIDTKNDVVVWPVR
jgi:hypothetical protein